MFSYVSLLLGHHGSVIIWNVKFWLTHSQLFPMLILLCILILTCCSSQVLLWYLSIVFPKAEAIVAAITIILRLWHLLLSPILIVVCSCGCWTFVIMFLILNCILWLVSLNIYILLSTTIFEFIFWLFSTNGSAWVVVFYDHYVISFLLTLKLNSILICIILNFMVMSVIILSKCYLIVSLLLWGQELLILLEGCIVLRLYYVLWAIR